MSSSTDKKKFREANTPIKVVDYPYYMPPPYVDQERVKGLAGSLREIANKYDIQIEMPAHDEVTMTGRRVDVDRFMPEFEDWLFGDREQVLLEKRRMAIFTSKPRDYMPKSLFDFDFATLERRFLARHYPELAWIYLPDPFEDRGEGGVE